MTRLAIIDRDRCKPNDCNHECHRFCPGVRMGKETIIFTPEGNPIISETLCSGSGICVKKCPYKAITIINLPEELDTDLTHRYGPNGFKLFRLPIVQAGGVLGLIGPNGTGKSTALKILASQMLPNLGEYKDPPSIENIIQFFKGTELQNFFKSLSQKKIKVAYKPQYVTKIPSVVKGTVGTLLEKNDDRGKLQTLKKEMDLEKIWTRELKHLSGGELQKVAVIASIIRDADIYLFDEPTSYLDVRERLNLSRAIRDLIDEKKTVVVVEHDLAALDYLSDTVSMFYGSPGNYGVVSHPHGVRVGINIFLNGFIPDENMRFRDQGIRFQPTPGPPSDWVGGRELINYYPMKKSFEGFSLETKAGILYAGEVVGILGPNGIGKTTFVKMIAGLLEPDEGQAPEYVGIPEPIESEEDPEDLSKIFEEIPQVPVEPRPLTVSYKPQYLTADSSITVEAFLLQSVGAKSKTSVYMSEVLRPLDVEQLLPRALDEVSGGELQRVAIAGCLGRDTDIYLLDEPSAFLDVEQRLAAAKTIKRIVHQYKRAAFIVEQ